MDPQGVHPRESLRTHGAGPRYIDVLFLDVPFKGCPRHHVVGTTMPTTLVVGGVCADPVLIPQMGIEVPSLQRRVAHHFVVRPPATLYRLIDTEPNECDHFLYSPVLVESVRHRSILEG
ncbi:hypothetical protein PAXINDRAFT_171933, partial [Paxillus involutus ATCC 200175]